MARRKRSPSPTRRRTKRFVFKSFAERVEAVDIDVFHRLDGVKFEPTQGTSFFHEALVQWRELNAAADFVDLFVELLPLVQTLPELLLHKNTVVHRLVYALQISAVLSLEPILSLLAILSRDLSADFQEFIPKIFDGFNNLLQNGGNKDAAVLEMVFTNIAYIFKYMQKYLSKDLLFVLKVTKHFRFHSHDYVRAFAAESASFLFRNAPLSQLIKGVRRLVSEAEQNLTEERVSAGSLLLTFTLKGSSGGFHSRAEELFKVLLNPSILCGIRDDHEGQRHAALEIVKRTFQNVCDEIQHEKIQLLWSCLLDELPAVMLVLERETPLVAKEEVQVVSLLTLLNNLMEHKKCTPFGNNTSLFDVSSRLLFMVPKLAERSDGKILSEILKFLLNSMRKQADARIKMPSAASAWKRAFECTPTLSLLPFIEGLLNQETEKCKPFMDLVLRALEKGIHICKSKVMSALQLMLRKNKLWDVKSAELGAAVADVVEVSLGRLKTEGVLEEAELVETALLCLPRLVKGSPLPLDYAKAVDSVLHSNKIPNVEIWTRLLGVSLQSHLEAEGSDCDFLQFGLKHASSSYVLEAVAQGLGARRKLATEDVTALSYTSLMKDCKIFEKNLAMPSKKLRQATLRILSMYEQTDKSDEVLQDLVAIESMPLDVESCRRFGPLVMKLRMNIGTSADEMVGVIFHAMIGVLQIRLTLLWNPAIDFLAEILGRHQSFVDTYFTQLSSTQERCLSLDTSDGDDEVKEFTTPVLSLMTSLLRTGQKGATALTPKTGEIVALFFAFVAHKEDSEKTCTGKDWGLLLKDWLQLLSQLKNISNLPNSSSLKELLTDKFLVFSDPDIQKRTMDCLLSWKDKHLTVYKEHIYNLIDANTFRDELATWNLGKDSGEIADEHRHKLVPVLVRILYPKLSKKNAKVGKSGGSLIRSTVLSFLSNLDVSEMSLLFTLIMRQFTDAFCSNAVDGEPAWSVALMNGDTADFIEWLDEKKVAEVPYKRKVGFLHLVTDVIQYLDVEHLEPYLPALVGLIVRILQSSSFNAEQQDGFSDKDLRTLCLKTISSILANFENVRFSFKYWESFFSAAEHSITHMKDENAHGNRPSALLACILEMSKDEELARLFNINELLVPNVLSVLHSEKLSLQVHGTVLRFVENLLGMTHETVKFVLLPHVGALLHGITVQITVQQRSKDKRSQTLLQQHLHILSSLSGFNIDSGKAREFLNTLLPFLKARKVMNAEIVSGVLKILRDLSMHFEAAAISKCVQAFESLLSSSSLSDRGARLLLCECLEKFSRSDASLSSVAGVLADLNSMSTNRIGELDFDRRQTVYGKLNAAFFSELESSQTLLVLSQVVFDLEAEDMRYNASSCLASLVRAAGQGVFKESVKDGALDFLFARILCAMQSEDSTIRREWLIIFRELVSSTSETAFLEYRCLLNSDVDMDFLSNIVHIQVHRRIKAMAKFRTCCIDSQFSQRALKMFFVPLFLHSLFEVRAAKDGNLVDATIETLGCIAAHLALNSAIGLVLDVFRMLGKKDDHQKVLVRLVCSVLDKVQSGVMNNKEMPVKELEEKILPQLDKLMMVESVNVPVAIATVKVLQLLPEDVISKHLPRICQTVTNLLKSRVQDTRDAARSAIVGMVEILGAGYLEFVVKMMKASLRRGYEKHVLGYTVNAILIRVAPQLSVGEVDHCVPLLLNIIEDEIFGAVSVEKEVEALARKMKERKESRSYDSVRLISQVMTFEEGTEKMLSMIKKQRGSSSTIQDKIQLVLKNVGVGVQENASATGERVFTFVQLLLEEFLCQNGSASKGPEDAEAAGGEESSSSNMHLISELGLNLLFGRLKGKQFTEERLSFLDSYVGVLHKCLCLKYDNIISGAIRCLSLVLKLPLPSISAVGSDIVSRVFFLAGRSVRSDSPLMQACIRLLTVLLRHCKSVRLTQAQVHELVQFNIFVDVESQGTEALTLLKAVVDRKLVVPELYDLMERVQKMMITSQLPQIRQKCSEILLQFLLDYPLGPKRLQQHINFLVANLGYEHVSGREAALEMLHTVIVKFPDVVIEEQSETLFLMFITRLANDTDTTVQVMLETALKVLMRRVGAQSLERMRSFLLSWLQGDNQALWQPAAQATRLLAEVMDKKFERCFNEFWPDIVKVLSEPGSLVPWRATYQALRLLEWLYEHFPEQTLSSTTEETWSTVQEFLMHRHVSVKKAAARLAATYIARTYSHPASAAGSKWLLLGAFFCEQMAFVQGDDELGALVAGNLTLLVKELHSTVFRVRDIRDSKVSRALLMLAGASEARLNNIEEECSGLTLVLRRLQRLGVEHAQIRKVLNWYSAIVTQLGERCVPYLASILTSLHKVERSTAADDLKIFATEIRDQIREHVSAERFATACNEVVHQVKSRSENRKRAASIATLVDPEKAARKRMKLGQKKVAQKKKRRYERKW